MFFYFFVVFLLFIFFFENEGFFGSFFSFFDGFLVNLFFLRSKDLSSLHLFFFIFYLVFYSLFFGFLPYCLNFLVFYFFILGFFFWLSCIFFVVSLVLFVEEGGSLSFFMYFLSFLSTLIQPVTLSLRISVNLFLGEILMLFLSFVRSPFLFFSSLFEFFVVFLQTSVFSFLVLSYFKN